MGQVTEVFLPIDRVTDRPRGFAFVEFGDAATVSEAMKLDGTELNGPADLTAALLERSDVLVTHFTERLMSYALGRRVEYYDMPTVREIVHEAESNDYRISSFVRGIVSSDAFLMARVETTEEMNSGGQ